MSGEGFSRGRQRKEFSDYKSASRCKEPTRYMSALWSAPEAFNGSSSLSNEPANSSENQMMMKENHGTKSLSNPPPPQPPPSSYLHSASNENCGRSYVPNTSARPSNGSRYSPSTSPSLAVISPNFQTPLDPVHYERVLEDPSNINQIDSSQISCLNQCKNF